MKQSLALSTLRMGQFNDLPDKALLSACEVSFLAGRSRTSLWRDVQRGSLNKPIKIGPNAVRWRVVDVKNFLNGNQKFNFASTDVEHSVPFFIKQCRYHYSYRGLIILNLARLELFFNYIASQPRQNLGSTAKIKQSISIFAPYVSPQWKFTSINIKFNYFEIIILFNIFTIILINIF